MVGRVDGLLAFSQFVTGRPDLRLCPTDLRELLAATATEQVAKSARHFLRLEIPPGLPPISADPDRLRQIVVNLLANAVQYSPEGGQVIVRASLEGDQVRVEVEDQGHGIESGEQQRVFDKFYRSSDAIISPIRGIGLGLAIVKSLVEAHGGRV